MKRISSRFTASRARRQGRAAKPRALKPHAQQREAKASRRPAKAGAKAKTARPVGPPPSPGAGARIKLPRLDRVRRTLEESVPTPPSSLNMDRHASAARTGRAELEEALKEHQGVTPAITAGDVDANWQQAYFTGDEAPGGDNPTPDQDVVDDIGKALGVQYEDTEELKSTEKVVKRDKHRWELDPASAEDYKERK